MTEAPEMVVEIAGALEEKDAIPAVRDQLEYLRAIQEVEFWDGLDVARLEDMRVRLRNLTQFLDKSKKKIVYTDFADEILDVRDVQVVEVPVMTGTQYQKKVKAFLQDHQDHIAIQRLKQNQPLTQTDLESLESALVEIGNGEGQRLLEGLLERSDAPSLAYFVRCMVGMDRKSAQAAFSKFLTDYSLTPQQIRFIEMVVDQLTSRGVMEASALYESPFTDIDTGGPEAVFDGKSEIVDGIFSTLKTVCEGLRKVK